MAGTALVTGASSGVGLELARQLAARGHDLVLVARRRDRLTALANELRNVYGVSAEVLVCDLADSEDRDRLLTDVASKKVDVEVLVLCAGFGLGGDVIDQCPFRLVSMVRTNVEATIVLAHHFGGAMAARRRGRILIVSSITGNQPMPSVAVYAATKAAVTSFAEALHTELRRHGVVVSAVLPGSIDTEFAEVAKVSNAQRRLPRFLVAAPGTVAHASLTALDRGERTTIPGGFAVRALHWIGGHAPRALWLRASHRLMA